ncbi:MAG: zinc ribbon domain-containing protein [Chloroflexi bacterium]|nr:zinc ribbon domain-containing protein [Chloroflexota bacterium]
MSDVRVVRCPQCGAKLPPGNDVVCEYCGTRCILGEPQPKPAKPEAPRRESGEAAQAATLRLKTVQCMDQQGIGTEAFRMLIPVDWVFEGGVHWLLNNPGMPAVIAFRARNAANTEAFEAFPNISFYWTNNPMVHMTFPIGALYFGNEVRPPMGAQQMLREIVLPRYRGKMAGLQIVREEPLPQLAQQVGAGAQSTPGAVTSADGARVRVRYSVGAQTAEEEIYGVVEVTQVSMPALFGSVEHIYWMADYLFSFRALQGALDGMAELFWTMTRSFQLNPQWYGRYMQVSQYLIQNQIQQIQHVGQLSRIISQTSSQISDTMMESWQQRQAAMDRISDNFSQAIRGVDEYYNPFDERGVELPGGHGYAWCNALGEYILSDDPNFNPNIGSNLNWQQMERRGP